MEEFHILVEKESRLVKLLISYMNFINMFILKEYEVLDLLGKGGFASVYRAKCRKSGMDVAIKMVFFVVKLNHAIIGRINFRLIKSLCKQLGWWKEFGKKLLFILV